MKINRKISLDVQKKPFYIRRYLSVNMSMNYR